MKKKLYFIALLLMCSFSAIQAQKLTPPSVKQFLQEYKLGKQSMKLSCFTPPMIIDGREMIDAFIALENVAVESLLLQSGVIVNSHFDGFVTAQIPVSRLEEISLLPGVTDIQISHRVQLCTDSTLSVTHTTQVLENQPHVLPASYDGTGVIIGIIDIGFDFQHRAFMRANDPSRSRIVRVYNTHDNSGHPAKNKNSVLPGSVFMGDEILRLTTDNSSGTHGTHTASIAAGTHVNGYGGMAPGADIVLCAVNVLDGSLSESEIANCVHYIDCYADSVNKPCVMSMSVSTCNGQHDGLDYLSKSIAQTMGRGRIFVISAGNNGGQQFYSHKYSTPNDPMRLLFKRKSTAEYDSTCCYDNFLAEIWTRYQYTKINYRFHVLDQQKDSIVWQSDLMNGSAIIDYRQLENYYTIADADTAAFIRTSHGTSSNGKKYRLGIALHNLVSKDYTIQNGVKKSRYALGISIYPSRTSDVDAWAINQGSRFGWHDSMVIEADSAMYNYYSTPSDDCNIGNYAVGDSIISAGAFIARNSYWSIKNNQEISNPSATIGQIASFSSYEIEGTGPTGKALPTICAPGYYVVAAGNRYNTYYRNSVYAAMKTDDGCYWYVMSGTSMAAPTVAGIIALWLQADPSLSVSQVKSIMAQTAIRDEFTDAPGGYRFGPNGKIDALAGIQLVLDHKGYMPGDVNGNNEVSIKDLTDLIDWLLTEYVDGYFDLRAADLNNNSIIDIGDVTTLIDILLEL